MPSPAPITSHSLNRTRRLFFGILVLIFVNFLWVASSELTRYIFHDQNFNRPFFTTYLKTCMFTVYLLGFVFLRSWRDRCLHNLPLTLDEDGSQSGVNGFPEYQRHLSEPEFEPIQPCSDCESEAGLLAEDVDNPPDPAPRAVRFQRTQEVRRLPDAEAQDAVVSRLPYEVWLRAQKYAAQYQNKLPIRKIAKLSLQFCLVWFLGNCAYQVGLSYTEAGVVNVLSSTSSLFTLILAAIFPSTVHDRFTFSKLLAVTLSISGVLIVTWVDEGSIEVGLPVGVIWSLVGAVCYAGYLVLLRHKVDSEEKLEIPMFFGFVGLFCLVFLWPGVYLLNVLGVEQFYPLPNRTQVMYITVNGLLGTVLSEYLWLWGCFLTSSLIATLSLTLTVPMTVIADRILWKELYPWTFYLGMIPIMLAFVTAALLAHYDNWDPVYVGLRRLLQKLVHLRCLIPRCCRRTTPRIRELDREQTEFLIT